MIYILTYLIIYILSAWRAWWWVRMAHYHPEGCLYNDPIHNDAYWVTFCPMLNTGFCVSNLFGSWKDTDTNIFKPKKPLT